MNNTRETTPTQKSRWLYYFPIVLILTLYLKVKNWRMGSGAEYREHQKEFFGKAKKLDEWLGANPASDKFASVRKHMVEAAFEASGSITSALDVATGYGFQAKMLRNFGIAHVSAIDLVPERIEVCWQLFPDSGIDFRVMDMVHTGFSDHSFDCVMVSAALHDLPNEARANAVKELKRITNKTLVILEPRTFPKGSFRGWTYGTLGSILDESLNFRDWVYSDIEKQLTADGWKIVLDENVGSGILNLKVCVPVAIGNN